MFLRVLLNQLPIAPEVVDQNVINTNSETGKDSDGFGSLDIVTCDN